MSLCTKIKLVVLPLCILIITVEYSYSQDYINDDYTKEWRLKDTFYITKIEIGSTGRIYAADSEKHQVYIFDASGERIRTVGEKGKGPGEFQTPIAITLAPEEERFAVRDRNRRVSLFSREGKFQSSFILPSILPSENLAFVKDTLLVLGGFEQQTMYTGDTMHLFTLDGERVRSFFPQSEQAKKLQISALVGLGFDLAEGNRIYAVQPVDYSQIGVFSTDGMHQHMVSVEPPSHFRGPTEPQPNPQDDSWGALEAWLEGVDAPRRLFLVSDEIIAVEVQKGGAPSERVVDFIEKESGRVVRSLRTAGRAVYADTGREWLYIATPQEDPVTVLRAYRVEDLIEGAGGE